MDKEWQIEMNKYSNPIEDTDISRKRKLISGYYSFPYFSRRVGKKFGIIDHDIQFLSKILAKNTPTTEVSIYFIGKSFHQK